MSELQRRGQGLKERGQLLNCRHRRIVVGRVRAFLGVFVSQRLDAGGSQILFLGIDLPFEIMRSLGEIENACARSSGRR